MRISTGVLRRMKCYNITIRKSIFGDGSVFLMFNYSLIKRLLIAACASVVLVALVRLVLGAT